MVVGWAARGSQGRRTVEQHHGGGAGALGDLGGHQGVLLVVGLHHADVVLAAPTCRGWGGHCSAPGTEPAPRCSGEGRSRDRRQRGWAESWGHIRGCPAGGWAGSRALTWAGVAEPPRLLRLSVKAVPLLALVTPGEHSTRTSEGPGGMLQPTHSPRHGTTGEHPLLTHPLPMPVLGVGGGDLQVSICGDGDDCGAHLHYVLLLLEPVGVGGQADAVPSPRELRTTSTQLPAGRRPRLAPRPPASPSSGHLHLRPTAGRCPGVLIPQGAATALGIHKTQWPGEPWFMMCPSLPGTWGVSFLFAPSPGRG